MGYRSDVRIIVSKKGFEKLKEFVKDYLKDKGDTDNLLEECDIKQEGKEQCYLGWNYVKWYEYDYNDVDAIMKGLEYLGENEYSYKYSRIGENYEDIEEQFFDGEKDEDVCLEYLGIVREFDDDYILNTIKDKQIENDEINKESIDI